MFTTCLDVQLSWEQGSNMIREVFSQTPKLEHRIAVLNVLPTQMVAATKHNTFTRLNWSTRNHTREKKKNRLIQTPINIPLHPKCTKFSG